jgi:periplasmic divalent cation tolerance protein
MVKLIKIKDMETEFVLTFTAVESYLYAVQIAKVLVTERLAACCTVLPNATSFYEWEGIIKERKENVLLIKSTKSNLQALKNRLVELHTDKVPEILAVKIEDGLKEYLEWVETVTK